MTKTIITYLTIVLLSMAVSLVFIEGLLRYTTILDQLDNPQPSYIPDYVHEQYQNVDQDGYADKFGFRSLFAQDNLIETLTRTEGCKIVILGDSFVWGSGLSINAAWPSQLQRMTQCAVFPFGKPGWSSYQYLNLYETYLQELEFDYLIVGVVANDPHPQGGMSGVKFKPDLYQRHSVDLVTKETQKKYFANLRIDDYLNSLIGGLLENRKPSQGSMSAPPIISWGYFNWRNRLYEPDVYEVWENAVVKGFQTSKHKACFLLTPTGNSIVERDIFEQLSNSLKKQGLTYLNMMPALDKLFNYQLRPRSAWAHLADGHPGAAQNRLYAEGAQKLLSICN